MFFHKPDRVVLEPARPDIIADLAGCKIERHVKIGSVRRITRAHADHIYGWKIVLAFLFLVPEFLHKSFRITIYRPDGLWNIRQIAKLKTGIAAGRADETEDISVPHSHYQRAVTA